MGTTYPQYADALLDSLYMTVITMTTIGYGDFAPSTPTGKIIGAPWMMIVVDVFSKTFSGMKDLTKFVSETGDSLTCSMPEIPIEMGSSRSKMYSLSSLFS